MHTDRHRVPFISCCILQSIKHRTDRTVYERIQTIITEQDPVFILRVSVSLAVFNVCYLRICPDHEQTAVSLQSHSITHVCFVFHSTVCNENKDCLSPLCCYFHVHKTHLTHLKPGCDLNIICNNFLNHITVDKM